MPTCGTRYANHFGLTQVDLDRHRPYTRVIQAAILRVVTEWITPDRQGVRGKLPFNLMKSEELGWTIQGVEYL